MGLTIPCETDESLSLAEFIEKVGRTVKPDDIDSLQECALYLRALSNNKAVVADQLNRELACWKEFQGSNRYTAQTMLLGGGEYFRVRANIWTPLSVHPGVREAENQLFFYRVPHDHNFSFLTVGHFGPGYETLLYEYDSSQVAGMPGERVRLNFRERTSLPEGKVMLYRAGRDVHSQEHAPAFSVSLNLLIDTPCVKTRNQYFFDLDSSTISDFVPSPAASRLMICHLARHMGDGRTTELLDNLAERHPSERLRAAAYDALVHLEPASAQALCERAAADVHPLVRNAARQALEGQTARGSQPSLLQD